MSFIRLIALFIAAASVLCLTAREVSDKNAVVTLVTGANSGYVSGAIALGQSLIDVGSKLNRVAMVTPDIDQKARDMMKHIWQVVEVQPISCNHNNKLDPKQFDLEGEKYQAGIKRWSATCTKFAAFTLDQFERIIFMDSDTLVVSPIDDAIYGFSNASFLAAPEAFPPDNFNSGFLVLNPSKKNFENIMRLNSEIGSAEGGDQGVFNNGLCPNWNFVGPDDLECGRLPWLFNVEAAVFEKYRTLRKMSNLRPPAVVHFVGDAKPWVMLYMEYHVEGYDNMPTGSLETLGQQILPHVLWREAFFRATGEQPSDNRILLGVSKKILSRQNPTRKTSGNVLKPRKVSGETKSKSKKDTKSGSMKKKRRNLLSKSNRKGKEGEGKKNEGSDNEDKKSDTKKKGKKSSTGQKDKRKKINTKKRMMKRKNANKDVPKEL